MSPALFSPLNWSRYKALRRAGERGEALQTASAFPSTSHTKHLTMAAKSCLALCACIAALSAAASARYIQAPPQSMNPAVRSNFNSKGFEEYFDEGKAGLLKNWWFSGVWANGQPFNVGWNPNSYNLNNYTVLELQVKKQAFTHSTGNHPYTAGELKSNDFYSAGSSRLSPLHVPPPCCCDVAADRPLRLLQCVHEAILGVGHVVKLLRVQRVLRHKVAAPPAGPAAALPQRN
jgi:hypothetical protein